jgi:hypothetical protein
LFSSTGFLGSSCSAFITKEFGALAMSITSTARKATTLFLSFALFNNVCTVEHLGGIFLFITALVGKSIRASRKGHGGDGSGGCDSGNIIVRQQQVQWEHSKDASTAFTTADILEASSNLEGYFGRNTNASSSGSSIKRRSGGSGRLQKNFGDMV